GALRFWRGVCWAEAGARCSVRSRRPQVLVDQAVDQVGVGLEPPGALLEAPAGLGRRGRAEDVTELQLAIPAAETLEALLLLVELSKRELGLGALAVELGLVLAALGQDLAPLLLAGGAELGLEPHPVRLVVPDRVQDDRLAGATFDQPDRPLH